MSIRNLAEAVILQALEDLFNAKHRKESEMFLAGEGFRLASKVAQINPQKRAEVLTFFGKLVKASDIYHHPSSPAPKTRAEKTRKSFIPRPTDALIF